MLSLSLICFQRNPMSEFFLVWLSFINYEVVFVFFLICFCVTAVPVKGISFANAAAGHLIALLSFVGMAVVILAPAKDKIEDLLVILRKPPPSLVAPVPPAANPQPKKSPAPL